MFLLPPGSEGSKKVIKLLAIYQLDCEPAFLQLGYAEPPQVSSFASELNPETTFLMMLLVIVISLTTAKSPL